MRFDRRVTFLKDDSHYDPKIHGYTDGDIEIATYPANVTDVGINKSVQVFGDYKHRALVIRTYYEPPKDWKYLTLDGDEKKYVLNTVREPLKYFTLIVGETSGDN